MSFEIIMLIVFILSLLGIIIFILRKIPILVNLSETINKPSGDNSFLKLKNRFQNTFNLNSFSFEIFLHKIISQIRILSLKTDSKTFNWLQKLREKSQKKKLENGNYWEELKNSNNRKKDLPG